MATDMSSVMLVTDNSDALSQELTCVLKSQGLDLLSATPGQELIDMLDRERPSSALIAPSKSSSWDGLDALARIRQFNPTLPLVLVAWESSEQKIIEAFRAGATDYIKYPCEQSELLSRIRYSVSARPALSWRYSTTQEDGAIADDGLVGDSVAMRQVKAYLRQAALSDSNVLITGETGTGKERVAQLIHQESLRSAERLVCINCAAVPESLLESELFGYERGAFTGAHSASEGKLKLAGKGSVFFDEIGDMSLVAQTKILRAIENKEIYRLGGKHGIPLEFRLIAATNQNLEAMLDNGTFREDLYYRLNVARIDLPALRERKSDIHLLARGFLAELNTRFGTDVIDIDAGALVLFENYCWPGNVRELRNVLEAALITRPSKILRVSDLPVAFRQKVDAGAAQSSVCGSESEIILAALYATNWCRDLAARKLNCSRMTLYRKMKKYNISDPLTR